MPLRWCTAVVNWCEMEHGPIGFGCVTHGLFTFAQRPRQYNLVIHVIIHMTHIFPYHQGLHKRVKRERIARPYIWQSFGQHCHTRPDLNRGM